MSVEFLVTALVVAAVPGTGVLYTVGVGLSRGVRASVLAAFGCTLGIVPHALAAVTGVAALLHASATAFQVLKYAGAAYLLFMAWSTWRDHGALAVEGDPSPRSGARVVVSGMVLNLLNPKLTIFFLAFLPQFVGSGPGGPLTRMLVLSGVFMALTFVVFVVYGRFSALVRERVVGDGRVLAWSRRGLAGAFALLGLRLAVAQP
ncbi:LysE family translocator [Nocardiopsis sp. FIRDI 009]|uniref:LysE family translocator n=1 Tax=Nocardiopsis sp. FIRDI 009 TaxID=714197 RepID=UPI000E27F12A|nr:LysE family translocator [Nocardiopsis sp. FIRDI 009]